MRFGPFRVLIVDDDVFFLKVMERLLGLEGFRVDTAASVETALRCFETKRPDLVLTDWRFPESTALGLVRAVHQLNPATPILVLTAYGEWENYLQVMNAGASDYFSKPISSSSLVEKIRIYLKHPQGPASKTA